MAFCRFRSTWLARVQRFGFLVLFVYVGLWAGDAVAQTIKPQLTSGTSSRVSRDEAISLIPLQEMTAEAQGKLTPVLQNPNIYRRLPTTAIEIDPEYFVFLCRYPEVVVETWRLMGVTQMATQRTAPFQFRCDDGAGTISDIELIYGNDQLHVFYGSGTYSGPVIRKPIDGHCVILLQTMYSRGPNGNTVATSQLDVFMKLENAAAGLVAKTLNPLVGRTADQNFVESLKFIQRLNETTEKNGPGVQGMSQRLTGLSPEVREQFIEIAGKVYDRAQTRSVNRASAQPMSVIPASTNTPVRYSAEPPNR